MLNKLADVLREVFWLKPAKKKAAPRKKTAAQKRRPAAAPAKKAARKPLKAAAKPAAKVVKKAPAAKPAKAPKAPKKPVLDPNLAKTGEVTHYFDRIKVCVVKITQGSVLIGDRLTVVPVKGSPFVQKIWSMQIESQDVKVAKKGQLIGIKIDKPVAPGDVVYK